MQPFRLLFLFTLLLTPALAWGQHAIENPQPSSTQSGISAISGWKCTANGPITVHFDGGEGVPLAYGTTRGDTASICQDDGNNGMALLWNWALLGDGQHTLEFRDNGVPFATVTVNVVTLGTQFLTGETSSTTATIAGLNVTLTWSQPLQSFVITGVTGGGDPSQLNGIYDYIGDLDESTCFVFIPEVQDTFQITQNGSLLTATASGGSLLMNGEIQPNGDFSLT